MDTEARAPLSAAPEGLTGAEARRRLARHGPNVVRPRPGPSVAVQLLRRFRNPLVLILLAASGVSAATGDMTSFAIVVATIVLSVAVDFFQEHRAGRSAEALARRVQVHAVVLRDGHEARLPVARLVPGDVVRLAAGCVVPGDGELLEAEGLHVNEALLTGEPFPAQKRPRAAGGREADDLFMGTSVVSGTATMRIRHTGAATQMGTIAASLAAEPPPTEFERGLRAFGLLVMRLTAFMVLFVMLVNTALARPLLDAFLFALALAVGLTPELLPMILSVTLARGALRLAGEHVIVKRLAAIESLGAMDVLCTDKTGTLTQAAIRVEGATDLAGAPSADALALARLNSAFQAGIPTPLDAALRAMGPADPGWTKLAELPFDFERRRVSVLLEREGRRLLVAKGAAEDLLEHVTAFARDGARAPWDEAARRLAGERLAALGAAGLRVIAVATRETEAATLHARDERALFLVGFVAFADPPKPGAARALARLAELGVAVKVLTGDGPEVTTHLCESLRVPVQGVLTGAAIRKLDDPALSARLEATNLFCRVSPAQKTRIVRLLQARGHAVGFLGDGINDAPALHIADVSLSVNNAVDVAREAADLILLRRDLDVVRRGVLEGRRTFVNIRKYVLMATSSNFGNMFSMAGASVFLPFLPLLPTQILLNNLLYDVSEIPIPLDRADPAETARPQKWDMGLVRDFMWVMGPVSSLFDFLTFYLLITLFAADAALFRTGWFVESLATQVLVIFVIRTRASPLASLPAPALALTSLAVVAVALALPFTPLAPALGFVAPPPLFFAVLAALAGAYLLLAEAVKRAFFRAHEKRADDFPGMAKK